MTCVACRDAYMELQTGKTRTVYVFFHEKEVDTQRLLATCLEQQISILVWSVDAALSYLVTHMDKEQQLTALAAISGVSCMHAYQKDVYKSVR